MHEQKLETNFKIKRKILTYDMNPKNPNSEVKKQKLCNDFDLIFPVMSNVIHVEVGATSPEIVETISIKSMYISTNN